MTREMKNSEVEWIGDIPNDWYVGKVQQGFRNRKRIAGENEEKFPRLSLSNAGVIEREKYDGKGESPADYSTYQIIPKGQFVFNFMGLEQDATYRRVGIAPIDGLVSAGYIEADYHSDKVDPMYSYFYFRFMESDQLFKQYGTGIRSNLNKQQFAKMPFLYPPLDIQNKIGKYIETKVNIISKLIDNVQQSICELKKYKRSIITESVTKGLKQDIEMKKSEISWIDSYPKTWNILKGKYLFRKMDREIVVDETITAFRDGQVVQRKKRRTDGFTNSIKEIGYQGINKGDLVIHSMDAFAGAIGVSEDNGKGTPVYIVLDKLTDSVNNVYYSYLLRSYSEFGYIESMAKGIRVRSSDFKYQTFSNTLLLVPPIEEQNRIVEFLDNKIKNIDLLINEKMSIISEYKQYQKSLIYEYVTGKKEV
ncbi:restriction endonuclease subunit S [Enterococcus caccae]|uniref:Type I restriction modification DNA specificity domain-containing protein n=1 Tax=Enterococcus caccae ATCC BAA-1240 TaxID=1158612 RepID=R3TXL3_9ENTE|nr:restriction endonuclease subunit S [Enterococcus caccae]EOL46354.1 hypothetical protein UC7_01321 [Enterococcus caccae ATCC BAA-1240]EOT60723.1 hypothetical protein I580_01623 [Enterococcus caccae ATCC BAA-1240]